MNQLNQNAKRQNSSIIYDAVIGALAINAMQSDRAATATDKQREFYECIAYPAVYFDPSAADDTGDGSKGRPFKNFTAARILTGRRHLIKAGTTIAATSGTWITIAQGSTAKSPVIIGRYGDNWIANPIIDGTLSDRVIRFGTNSKYNRIRDIDFKNLGGAGSDKYMISQNSVDAIGDQSIDFNNVISRCSISNVGGHATTDCNAIKLYGANNEIIGNEIYNISTDGIWFHGFSTIIEGNRIYKVSTDGRKLGDCIQCGAKSDGSIIRGNYLEHFEVDSKQCIYFEATVSISDNVLIEDNYCVHSDSAGIAGVRPTGITCGATNSTVRRNFVKGGYVGIELGLNTQCYSNVIQSTVGRGIAADTNGRIYNNTIYQTGAQNTQSDSVAIFNADSAQIGNIAWNNLIYNQYNGITCVVGVDSNPTIREYNNSYIVRGVSVAKYRIAGIVTAPTNEIVSTISDFDANYRPKTSILAYSGTNPYPSYDKDKVLSTPCVGAYSG